MDRCTVAGLQIDILHTAIGRSKPALGVPERMIKELILQEEQHNEHSEIAEDRISQQPDQPFLPRSARLQVRP